MLRNPWLREDRPSVRGPRVTRSATLSLAFPISQPPEPNPYLLFGQDSVGVGLQGWGDGAYADEKCSLKQFCDVAAEDVVLLILADRQAPDFLQLLAGEGDEVRVRVRPVGAPDE